MVNSSRGRPAGQGNVRELLIDAALPLFREHGYHSTSLREIAQRAGTSHSLVKYYFRSKEGLFTEAMSIHLRPSAILDEVFEASRCISPLATAYRLIHAVTRNWDAVNAAYPMSDVFGRAVSDEQIRQVVAGFIGEQVIDRLAHHIGGRDGRQKAVAVADVIAGMILSRYLLGIEPLASKPAEEVAQTLAPMVAFCLKSSAIQIDVGSPPESPAKERPRRSRQRHRWRGAGNIEKAKGSSPEK